MTNWIKIEEILRETRDAYLENPMFDNAMEINCGYCAEFLKLVVSKLEKENIEYKIIVTQDFELMDELEGYETFETENEDAVSHCYLEIDGWYFDAQDVDGSEESEMSFLNNSEYI